MKSTTHLRIARAAACAVGVGIVLAAARGRAADAPEAPAGDESLKTKCIELIRENSALRQQIRELEQQSDRRAREAAPVDGDVRERLRNLEQAFAHFTEERQRLRGDNERLTTQIIEASRQTIAATNELAAARAKAATLAAEIEALKTAAREEARSRAAEKSLLEAEGKKRDGAAAAERGRLEAEIEKAAGVAKEREGAIERLEAAVEKARQDRDRAAAAKRGVEEERDRLAGQRADAEAGAAAAKKLMDRLQHERGLLMEHRDSLKAQIAELKAARRAAEDRAAALESENREVLRLRMEIATMHYEAGRLTQAHDAFRSILATHPDDGQAHFNLAAILLHAKPPQAAEADRHYREALRLGEERDEAIEQRLAELAPAPQPPPAPAAQP